MLLSKRDIWRVQPTAAAPFCNGLKLPPGHLLANISTLIDTNTSEVTFIPQCHGGKLSVSGSEAAANSLLTLYLNATSFNNSTAGPPAPGDTHSSYQSNPNNYSVASPALPPAPTVSSSPLAPYQMPYYRGAVPLCCCTGAASSLVWVLMFWYATTLASSPNRTVPAIALVCTAIGMVIISAVTFIYACDQFESGYSDGFELSEQLGRSLLIIVTMTIQESICRLCQVSICVRIFSRPTEKRLVCYIGTILSVVGPLFQLLHKVYYDIGQRNDAQDAVIVCAYLLDIAVDILFFGCILLYLFAKLRLALLPSNIWLTAFVIMSSTMPVICFILNLVGYADIVFSRFLTQIANVTSCVCFIEWSNRISTLERQLERDSVLGHRTFLPIGKEPKCINEEMVNPENDFAVGAKNEYMEQDCHEKNSSRFLLPGHEESLWQTLCDLVIKRTDSASTARTLISTPDLENDLSDSNQVKFHHPFTRSVSSSCGGSTAHSFDLDRDDAER